MNGRDKKLSHRELMKQESDRVQAMLERDRVERVREAERAAAIIDLENGKSVSIVDAVIEPTPEWLEKGAVEWFTPRLEDGTVRTVKAARRPEAPLVMHLWGKGNLSDDQTRCCLWYRNRHEVAGLTGRVKTSHISLTGSGGGSGGAGQSPMALHEYEAKARAEFRAAREAMTAFYLKFFDSVVIHDIPLRRAARFARCRNDKAIMRFRAVAQELVEHCDREKVDLSDAFGDE